MVNQLRALRVPWRRIAYRCGRHCRSNREGSIPACATACASGSPPLCSDWRPASPIHLSASTTAPQEAATPRSARSAAGETFSSSSKRHEGSFGPPFQLLNGDPHLLKKCSHLFQPGARIGIHDEPHVYSSIFPPGGRCTGRIDRTGRRITRNR